MNYQEFLTTIKTKLSLRIDSGLTITIQTFIKNNGTRHDGLIIQDPGLNVSPTIYLKPYYHRYLDGVSLEDICEDILSTYHNNLPQKDFDITLFTDYRKASGRIVMRLINREKNKELLKNVPHFSYLDLEIVFYCMLCAGELGQGNILIRKEHMESWGVTAEELREQALINTPKLLPPDLISMNRLLKEHNPEFLKESRDMDIRMYILTNEFRTNGATTLLYEGILEEIAGMFDSDIILLPSSIHEVILVPAASGDEYLKQLDDFSAMVKEVNETELADEEILSDHAYYYIKGCGLVGYRPK